MACLFIADAAHHAAGIVDQPVQPLESRHAFRHSAAGLIDLLDIGLDQLYSATGGGDFGRHGLGLGAAGIVVQPHHRP